MMQAQPALSIPAQTTARALVVVCLTVVVGACGAGSASTTARTQSPVTAHSSTASPAPPMPRSAAVSFRASDGWSVHGDFVGAGGRAPGLILVHQSDGDANQWDQFVPYLHQAGYATLAYDGRGGLDELSLKRDFVGALRFLKHQRTVDPRRIGVVGASIGGTVALLAANGRIGRQVRVAIALSPADSATEFSLQDHGNWHPHDVLLISDRAESTTIKNAFPGCRRCKLLFASGTGHGVDLLPYPAIRGAVLRWLGASLSPNAPRQK